jgi:hypothetical protein
MVELDWFIIFLCARGADFFFRFLWNENIVGAPTKNKKTKEIVFYREQTISLFFFFFKNIDIVFFFRTREDIFFKICICSGFSTR